VLLRVCECSLGAALRARLLLRALRNADVVLFVRFWQLR
jgi:hypothetical protein